MFETLLGDERVNAGIGWLGIGIVALAVPASLLGGEALWAGFALAALTVVLLPPLRRRDRLAMAPWPVVALLAVAVGARSLSLFPETVGYVAIAALAVTLVVELEAFTPVRLSRRFAVVFAMLTSLAIAALWIIAQFYADATLGTTFMESQAELQRDIVVVAGVGLVVGVVFELVFITFERLETIHGLADHEGGQ